MGETVAVAIWLAGMPVLWLATLDDNGTMPQASVRKFAALVLLWPLFGFTLWAMGIGDLIRAVVKRLQRPAPQ